MIDDIYHKGHVMHVVKVVLDIDLLISNSYYSF